MVEPGFAETDRDVLGFGELGFLAGLAALGGRLLNRRKRTRQGRANRGRVSGGDAHIQREVGAVTGAKVVFEDVFGPDVDPAAEAHRTEVFFELRERFFEFFDFVGLLALLLFDRLELLLELVVQGFHRLLIFERDFADALGQILDLGELEHHPVKGGSGLVAGNRALTFEGSIGKAGHDAVFVDQLADGLAGPVLGRHVVVTGFGQSGLGRQSHE